ncbi:threonine synthase-like 2 isoform X2 [Conger conger]|uniref:threonine synthase-like 2 isoform X2 n=1 Tax=Conger conger TaxID=82655 RepID=UPI002A5A151F|nr:threonine synthase-like 2 isoform X2 [Conger conger]
MRYCSTRGEVQGWGFREVLFSGYAPDGGMFMPETLPTITPDTLRSWTSLSYPRLVHEVCALFIPDDLIPRHDLDAVLSGALSQFSVPGAVRLARLGGGLSVLELFHGETLAFKDLAMTCTTRLLDYFLQRESRRATVLVGTSGDTGGSAIRGARGLRGVDVVVVFPRGRITAVQEKHMTTSLEDNIHVFAADGSSDDIDVPLRCLFADRELVKEHGLMSLNSVNWCRILVQLAHFLYAYLQLSGLERTPGGALPRLEVVVPTGGAGNITAGCIMKEMGVPLRLVAMVNANDIVHRAVQSGDFSMATQVKQTLASAIDIQDPYNMERVFWLLSGRDGLQVKGLMEEFQRSHKITLPDALHRKVLHSNRVTCQVPGCGAEGGADCGSAGGGAGLGETADTLPVPGVGRRLGTAAERTHCVYYLRPTAWGVVLLTSVGNLLSNHRLWRVVLLTSVSNLLRNRRLWGVVLLTRGI